jgi:hypothetical protein
VVFQYAQASAVIDVAWKPYGLALGGVLVVGDRGEAVYEGRMTRGPEARFRIVRGNETILDQRRAATDEYVDAFYGLQHDFAAAMRGTGPRVQRAEDNLRTLIACFAAYDAAASVPTRSISTASQ